jgi:hypothetical protein
MSAGEEVPTFVATRQVGLMAWTARGVLAEAPPIVQYRFAGSAADGRVANLVPGGGYAGLVKGGARLEFENGVEFLRFDGFDGRTARGFVAKSTAGTPSRAGLAVG